MSRLIISTFLLCCTLFSTATATCLSPSECTFKGIFAGLGPYFGARIGAGHLRSKANETFGMPRNLSTTDTLYDTEFLSQVYLGIGQTLKNKYYYALEIGGNLNKMKASQDDMAGLPNKRSCLSFNLRNVKYFDLMGGYILHPHTMLFFKFGFTSADVSARRTREFAYWGCDSVDGYRVGVGASITVNDYFSLVAQYIHSRYTGFDVHKTAPAGRVSASFRPDVDTLSLGINVHILSLIYPSQAESSGDGDDDGDDESQF